MKKTVFLFILGLLMTSFTNVEASYGDKVFQFDNYEIRLIYKRNETDELGYYMEKVGENPFQQDFFIEDCNIWFRGAKEVDGKIVFYGFIHQRSRSAYYSGLLVVLDQNGQIAYQVIQDYDYEAEIRELFVFDDTIITYTKTTDYNENERRVLDSNIFTSYDLTYEKINEISTQDIYLYTTQNEHMILLSYWFSEPYQHGITKDLTLIEEHKGLLINDGEIFQDEVTLFFLNDAVLNGEVINNGVTIRYPGNYQLNYNDYTYHFKVTPSIQGVIDGEVYNDPVTPVITQGNLFLNDDLYVSGTPIEKPGNYTIRVEGANDFIYELEFQITSNIEGVLHNQHYVDSVDVSFNGEGYLNNVHIESPYQIEHEGEYILKIEGEGGYQEVLYFNISEPEDDTSFLYFLQKWDVVVLIVVVIAGWLILKKKSK